jgi:hypothetical protein
LRGQPGDIAGLGGRCRHRGSFRRFSVGERVLFFAADGLARLAPRGVDIVIDALGGALTGQAVAAWLAAAVWC